MGDFEFTPSTGCFSMDDSAWINRRSYETFFRVMSLPFWNPFSIEMG